MVIRDRLGDLYLWDDNNPGGHYVLNLRDERHRQVTSAPQDASLHLSLSRRRLSAKACVKNPQGERC